MRAARVLVALFAAGCTGTIEGPREDRPSGPPPPSPEVDQATSGIPRLSRREVENAVASVFGLTGYALRNLPADPGTAISPVTLAEEEVFDTLAAEKAPTTVFVEGLENLAFEVGRDFAANPAAVSTVAGCTPAATSVDAACLAKLVDAVALRLWRRLPTSAERDALTTEATAVATQAGAGLHLVAVRTAVTALVQSPEFVYRLELGTPAEPGFVRLTDAELVSRLAAFLWGSNPSPDLLASVATQALDDAALGSLVDAMLSDPRSAVQQRNFHRLWLRYDGLLVTDATLAADMRAEADALVDRSLAGVYRSLFSSTQTFVTPALATHYGLTSPGGSAGWVDVAGPRAGILSQGAFLSLSSTRVSDTLPSRRGAMLARRVFCQTILPPPKDVNIDNGVTVPPGACKTDAYQAHRSRGACAGCHAVIDGLGFGFEQLDGLGRVRDVEAANASCHITGTGTFGAKPFVGAKDLVAQNEAAITDCAVDQLTRFAFRERKVANPHVTRFREAFTASGYDFKALMRSIALDDRFRVRAEAP